jgi:histidyl-tRNA synthetase
MAKKKKKKKKSKKKKKKSKKKKKKKKEEEQDNTMDTPQLLRGFRDTLPEEQKYWDFIRDTARSLADAYSFSRIELPLLEDVEVFKRPVGENTDIVEKEMYTFTTPGDDEVALRPEATAQMARAYINHGMFNRPQPVKMWYMGPMFRYDRPQAGRYRQFNQFGFETIGVDEPIVDAQLITIATQFFRDLGIDITVQINSIGTPETRKAYLTELVSYFREHRDELSDTDKSRLQNNPLRLLDSKDDAVQELLVDAPQIIDWLDDDSKDHFMKVLEFLDEVEVPYVLNPHLVRGLDYYTRTVFEIWEEGDEGENSQNALGGGGRYDGLIELMGGREDTPACGFAIGVERVANILEQTKSEEVPDNTPNVFFAQLGEDARRIGLRLVEHFREADIPLVEAFGKNKLTDQLEMADKLDVDFTLILGQKEVLDDTIIIRDMESGSQETVPVDKVVSELQKRLDKLED